MEPEHPPVFGPIGGTFVDFHMPCARHDFGYRNGKALGIWSEPQRAHIDAMFLSDTRQKCVDQVPFYLLPSCFAVAELYYTAVRNLAS